MRVIILLIFFFAASFGELDFNSKTRNFSIELLYHTVRDSNEDVVISPYAIWCSLISTAYEATGATREEFSKLLSLTEDRSKVVEEYKKLRTALLVNDGVPIILLLMDFVFYDEGLNVYSNSIRRLESDFGYTVRRFSFQEPQQALDSVQSVLGSYHVPLINILRTEVFEDSTMIMCNYCSFQAEWLNPFNVSNTTPVHYYQVGNLVGKVYMMHMKARLRSSDLESLHASVTELPYRGGKYCMLLVRPHAGYDLAQVLRNLREVSLKDVLDTLQRDADEFGMREVEVKLPTYNINLQVVLNRPLIDMGLSDGFDRNLANFEYFAEDKIYIGEITQRVNFILSPFETIVYATTPAYPLSTRTPKQIPVKEPFILFIMEKTTATVLFGGSHSKI